jgi:hypothetical protein
MGISLSSIRKSISSLNPQSESIDQTIRSAVRRAAVVSLFADSRAQMSWTLAKPIVFSRG